VISKVHVRKLLQINRLQKSLYGRLSRRRYSCAGDRPWVRIASGEARERVFGEPGVLLVTNLMLEIAVSIRNLLRCARAGLTLTVSPKAEPVLAWMLVRLPRESALRTIPAEGQPSTPAASPALRYAKKGFSSRLAAVFSCITRQSVNILR